MSQPISASASPSASAGSGMTSGPAAAPRPVQISVRIEQNGKLLEERLLDRDSVTIGRSQANLLCLDTEGVADLHAVLKLNKDQQMMLTDLGSDEGTFVAGERVDMRVVLKPGHRVQVGPFELLFTVHDPNRRPSAADVASALASGSSNAASDAQLEADSALVAQMLFANWDKQDALGTDNKTAPRVMEVYEVWGDIILSAKEYPRSIQTLTLANHSGPDAEFVIDREFLPAERMSLIAQVNGVPHLQVPETVDGWLYEAGEPTQLRVLARSPRAVKNGGLVQLPLTEDSRFIVKFGHIHLIGGFVLPAVKLNLPLTQGVDTLYLGLLTFFFLVMGSFTLYLRTLPVPEATTSENLEDRYVEMLVKKEEKKPEEKKEIKVIADKKEEEKKETPKPKEPEKEGKKDNKIKLAKDKAALDQTALDKKAAENAGLLADLKAGGSLFNSGLSGNISNAAQGLLGTTGKSAISGGVAGSRGLGFGGGDSAGGVGGIGTKGGGGGGPGGYGANAGLGGRKKQNANIDVSTGDALVLGNIDKAQIEKVIRDNLTQIRYCYSRELNKNPSLAGKIVVRFTISADGSVPTSSVKDSTMGNSIVEDCISKRVMSLRFPEPRGGGSAIVTYPFIFKAAG